MDHTSENEFGNDDGGQGGKPGNGEWSQSPSMPRKWIQLWEGSFNERVAVQSVEECDKLYVTQFPVVLSFPSLLLLENDYP